VFSNFRCRSRNAPVPQAQQLPLVKRAWTYGNLPLADMAVAGDGDTRILKTPLASWFPDKITWNSRTNQNAPPKWRCRRKIEFSDMIARGKRPLLVDSAHALEVAIISLDDPQLRLDFCRT